MTSRQRPIGRETDQAAGRGRGTLPAKRVASRETPAFVAAVPAWAQVARLSSARRDTPAIANTETDLATRERLPRLLTVPEVAAGLRVSTKTVRRMVEKGEIQAVRIGRAIRISEADYVCRTRTG